MVDDTGTGGRALVAQVAGYGDAEACLVCGDRDRVGSENIPGDQRLANHGVGSGVNDGHVGNTGVWCADVKGERNHLPGSVRLDKSSVVGIFVSLAHPDVALGGVVVGLRGGDLEHALDVAVVVFAMIRTMGTSKRIRYVVTYHLPGCSRPADRKQPPYCQFNKPLFMERCSSLLTRYRAYEAWER